jgi:hypothetical protein
MTDEQLLNSLQGTMVTIDPYSVKKEAANELYRDALQELDNIAVGDVESADFMNAYLVIQTALKVALGEEDV